MLVVPRALVGVSVAAMMWLIPDGQYRALLLAGLYFVVVSLLAHRALATAAPQRGPFLWTTVADAVGCFAVLAILSNSPNAPGMLLFPLLGFELALKYCVRGTAVAMVLLALGLAARSTHRAEQLGSPPRLWLILLLIAATGLLLGVAGTLRVQERDRRQALSERRRAERDRQRLAALLRETVQATLNEVDVTTTSQQRTDLLVLVERACADPAVGSEVTRRLALAVAPPNIGPLSVRESEILALVASGMSDREIAGQLFVSQGTVRVHVSNIVRKLGVDGRPQAIAWHRNRHEAPALTGLPSSVPV